MSEKKDTIRERGEHSILLTILFGLFLFLVFSGEGTAPWLYACRHSGQMSPWYFPPVPYTVTGLFSHTRSRWRPKCRHGYRGGRPKSSDWGVIRSAAETGISIFQQSNQRPTVGYIIYSLDLLKRGPFIGRFVKISLMDGLFKFIPVIAINYILLYDER